MVLVHLILSRKISDALRLNLIFFLRFLFSSSSLVGILRIHLLPSGFAFLLISEERLLASGCVFSN